MNLQLELYKFQREFFARIPPEKAAIIKTANQYLAEAFKNRRTLRIGDLAPDFSLQNTEGKTISLSEQLKNGPVLISFFRGCWCPYCDLELRAYQRVFPKIQALEGTILAVSPQTPEMSLKTAIKNALSFEILSDRGCKVAQDYDLAFEVSDPLKQLYIEFGHALPNYNGTEDWLLPVPATFIINPNRHIVLAHIDVDYTKRYEPADAIAIFLALFVE